MCFLRGLSQGRPGTTFLQFFCDFGVPGGAPKPPKFDFLGFWGGIQNLGQFLVEKGDRQEVRLQNGLGLGG